MSIHSQDLPHRMTEEERVIWKSYNYPVNPLFSDPPMTPVRGMAEWEELQGVIITWRSFYTILKEVVDYAQEEGIVYIICSDSNSVKNYLINSGVPLHNLKYLITPSNSIWVRDYGPWTAYTDVADTLSIIDWIYNRPRPLDDVTPVFFANYINTPIYQTTTYPYDLIQTGGNLFIDGHGTAFSSNLIIDENPTKTEAEIDTIMMKFLGVDRYIKLTNLPYDVIHHIDMHMKLLDEETLLVGEYPPGVADGPQIEANLQYVLQNYQTCFGREFNVVRIPMPPDALGRYPDIGGDYRTYTNSIIINKTVIIPTYEYQYDTTAFRIYREAMPGYNIVGINSNSIILSLGAIHCIVKEVGAFDPIFISHPKREPVVAAPDSIRIQAVIKTNSGITDAFVHWTADTTTGFDLLPMEIVFEDTFIAYIPQQINGTKIFYYISAISNNGKTITKPLPAPAGSYKFIVENNITIAGNVSQPEEFYLSQNYPNPFNPATKIKFQIPELQFVTLKVYDILGNEISTLINEEKPVGSYEVNFNSASLPSGIYFYKLQAGDFAETKKMVLMK
jgi:agmatine/peptidylarginine deiminase